MGQRALSAGQTLNLNSWSTPTKRCLWLDIACAITLRRTLSPTTPQQNTFRPVPDLPVYETVYHSPLMMLNEGLDLDTESFSLKFRRDSVSGICLLMCMHIVLKKKCGRK